MYGTWTVSDAAFDSLVDLCADICKRYGFELGFTGDSSGSLTRHNFYANTNCPGPYLESKTAELVKRVNAKVRGDDEVTPADKKEIAQLVWEYIYHAGLPDEDKTLQLAGYENRVSNRYNVLNKSFQEVHAIKERLDAIEEKLAHLEIGDVSIDVDYSKVAKAVNDDAAKRLQD